MKKIFRSLSLIPSLPISTSIVTGEVDVHEIILNKNEDMSWKF